jgi:TolA-binding protein
MVFPDGNTVKLTYRRIPSDWLGIALSLVGLAIVAVGRRRVPLGEPQGALVNGLNAVHPLLVVAGVVLVISTTGWHILRDFGPQHYYKRGWEAFQKQDYVASYGDFDMAMWLGGDTNQAADAGFFRAASLFRQNQFNEALAAYQHVIDKFPDSIWIAESHYHVGLCLRRLGKRDEAMAKFRYVVETYPGNRWAGFSQEQLTQMEKEAPPPPAPAPAAP